MDSILLREIIMTDSVNKKKKNMFKKDVNVVENEETKYSLFYRIDEDRYWYRKEKDGKIIEEHHTKNGVQKSMEIMDGIYKRLKEFNNNDINIIDNNYLSRNQELADKFLKYEGYEVYDLDNEFIIDNITNMSTEIKYRTNKSKIHGILLDK